MRFQCPCGDMLDVGLAPFGSVWCRECRENPERRRCIAELYAKVDILTERFDRLVGALEEFAEEAAGNPHAATRRLKEQLCG